MAMKNTRRNFLNIMASGTAGMMLSSNAAQFGQWQGWKKGHFQIHSIYTGCGESMFLIFPDSTTMLIDCGDFDAAKRGELAMPALPNRSRHAGEWVARYVQRVNPNGADVDYMMISHFHKDHVGTVQWHSKVLERAGKPYYLSGLSEVAEFLHFRRAIDRTGGVFDGSELYAREALKAHRFEHLIGGLYGHLKARDGLDVQKFKVGAEDQIIPLRGECENFKVRNICGNGKIALPDGTIIDALRPEGILVKQWNENHLSIGSVFSYGRFSFYTAGDFSAGAICQDGRTIWPERDLAKAIARPVSVAKANHHAYKCMLPELVRKLQAKVYTVCTWDVLHCTDDSLERLTDPANQKIRPIIVPGYFAPSRCTEANSEARKCFPKEIYTAVHSVIDVPPGGETFSVSLIDARNEDMNVLKEIRAES